MLQRAGHSYAQHQHGPGCGPHSGPEAGSAPVQRSTVHDVLRAPGRSLDETTRMDMEARLGADFSDVRIHDGSAARESAAEVGARAYTSGSHVVIGEGGGDRHTLAHELTHVIQQRQGPVAGTDNGDGLSVSDPSDRFEREAEANAHDVLRGPAPDLQRAPVGDARGTTGPADADTGAVQRMMPAPAGQAPAPAQAPAQVPTLVAVDFPGSRDIADDPMAGTGYTVTHLRNETPTALVEVHGLDGLTGISLLAREGGNLLGVSMPQDPVGGVMTFNVPLITLPGAGTVGNMSPVIEWELFDAGQTTMAVGQTMHTFYRLFDNPTTAMRFNAVHEATTMAAGQNDGQGVATALRGAINGRVPYNGSQYLTADPLTLLSSAPSGAVCSDFANLHIMLAQTLGLQANAVLFWGGFQHGGHSVWAADATNGNNTLTNVQATNPANNPGGGPQGWDFTYHAIANIGGTLHDAALNREGFAAEAIHEGLWVLLPELLPVPATPFAATAQTAFSVSLVSGTDVETVGVALRQHGARITDADFAANVLSVMPIPPGTPAAHQDPVQLIGGALPPGLALAPDGTLAGIPTTPGTYTFTVFSSLNTPVTYSMVVN
ncbi:DUF4157 domain-containing protein [Streptomyces sp. NPDC059247]|uniref:eCIS core domain-containing protein n=1 Tax=Streptomyces sp. NPDC059247 TaxID=3346790 RepID=UPI003684DB4A